MPDGTAQSPRRLNGVAGSRRRQVRGGGFRQVRWVTGDEVYGGNSGCRDALDGDGLWYPPEVPTTGAWPLRELTN